MKRTFAIDWGLIPISALSVATGIGFHIAGHGINHALWHAWAVAHSCVSLLFVLLAYAHIRAHWGWYSGWFKNGLGKKSRITAAVSLLFALLVLTGVALLGIEGANSGIGLWHYRIGLVATLFFIGHTIKRFPILRNVRRK